MATETAPQELMDRIAARFGFPGGEKDPEPAGEQVDEVVDAGTAEPAVAELDKEAQPENLFDLEIDGETFQLPQKLKDAFMRTQDYTSKTQALGEERRSIDQVKSLAEADRMQYAFTASIAKETTDLARINEWLEEASRIDIRTLPADERVSHIYDLGRVEKKKADLMSAIEGKRSKFQQDMQAKINDLRGKAREIASKSIPGFGEQTEKTMRDYAKSEGFTDHEIDNVLLDPRSVKAIWKAAQYDAIKAGTAKAGEQAKQAEKGALRPGAAGNKMPTETAQKLNYRKAIKAAKTSAEKAALIEQRLAGVFSKG